MKEYNSISLTRFAATIAKLIGVEPPAYADQPVDWVYNALTDICEGEFDRVLIHNPDCIGMWLYKKFPDAFEPVMKHTHLTIPFCSVLPSVTPVCFATMYTGAEPAVHGIRKYEKPIVPIDTLFEALTRAGKKVAILAPATTSMGTIFQGKGADLYACASEGLIMEKAQELIVQDQYDVICVYTYKYDSIEHDHGPLAREAVTALYQQTAIFDLLMSSVKREWKNHNTLITFSPDHGVHTVAPDAPEFSSTGVPQKGNHGSDRPSDLNILHYFGVVPRAKAPDYTE